MRLDQLNFEENKEKSQALARERTEFQLRKSMKYDFLND